MSKPSMYYKEGSSPPRIWRSSQMNFKDDLLAGRNFVPFCPEPRCRRKRYLAQDAADTSSGFARGYINGRGKQLCSRQAVLLSAIRVVASITVQYLRLFEHTASTETSAPVISAIIMLIWLRTPRRRMDILF